MKIVGVVVDELPENCGVCPFCNGLGHFSYPDRPEWYEIDCSIGEIFSPSVKTILVRPDWCPLILRADKLSDILISELSEKGEE